MGASDETTSGIRVQVESRHKPERSAPGRAFFFAYRIRITNVGDTPAQLVARHWIITNGNGQVEHVRGPGVVGETPRLTPGTAFEYESSCPLATPLGAMRGQFQMVRDDGTQFEAEVGEFSLEVPDSIN